jgi:hypothetical protein
MKMLTDAEIEAAHDEWVSFYNRDYSNVVDTLHDLDPTFYEQSVLEFISSQLVSETWVMGDDLEIYLP